MDAYWIATCERLLPKNREVLNSFLLILKEKGLSKQTVTRYRGALQSFFLSHSLSYESVTEEVIEEWLLEERKHRRARTVKDYLKTIRAFYNFCVQGKQLTISPLDVNLQTVSSPERYWELKITLPNQDNQEVINQFLLHLKNVGRTESTIVTKRVFLQSFFEMREQSFRTLTLEEIDQWMTDNQQRWNKKTLSGVMSGLRTFYDYCWEEEIMDKPPLRNKKKVFEATDSYWEVKGRFPLAENKQVINEYLLYLKNKKRSQKTIEEYGFLLKRFFGESPSHFSSVKRKHIDQWFSQQDPNWYGRTIDNYRDILRLFYFFCVRKGYVTQSPIRYKWDENNTSEKFWETRKSFHNTDNKVAINEFLLTMKLANMSEMTIYQYKYMLETFFMPKEERFSTVLPKEILEWVIQLQKVLKATTVNRRLAILSSFYTFCVNEGYMENVPIKTRWFPRLPKPMPKYLEKEELAKVRQNAEKEMLRNRIILEFLLSSGCRIRELHLLNKSDVDLENRTARVIGKGRKIREVHFSETCAILLERYWEIGVEEEHPALIVSERGTRLGVRRLQEIVEQIGVGAGVTGSLYPHRLRHTFATELLTKGADLSFIADELGHANLQTTKIYARLPKWKLIRLYRRYMG